MPEVYLTGGDTLIEAKNEVWLGQSFQVLEPILLQFIDLELRGAIRSPDPLISVWEADSGNIPQGDNISRNRHTVESKAGFFTTGRARFSMTPVHLTTDKNYVLMVRNFPPLGGNQLSWQYDQSNGAYRRGNRIHSINGGVNWTNHYSDDFMFAVFGNPPLTKPDPPPPIDYFATIGLSFFHNPTSITITLKTSVPCHLSIYHTDSKPLSHHTSRLVRGLEVPWGQYFCFVAWIPIEQEEEGDTIVHTFKVLDWLYFNTKWFTFRGTVDLVVSPSVGPIFKHLHTGILPFCNLSFDDYPTSPGVPPCWDSYFLFLGVAGYTRDEINVQHGLYSLKITAVGTGFVAGVRQYRWSVPYLDKTVKFTWHWYGGGRGMLGVASKGSLFNFGGGWHTKSWNVTFGPNPTLFSIRMAAGGGSSSFTQLSWDNITIEIL